MVFSLVIFFLGPPLPELLVNNGKLPFCLMNRTIGGKANRMGSYSNLVYFYITK